MRSELVLDVQLCAFAAVGLVMRCADPTEYDDAAEAVRAARHALDELQLLLPLPKQTVDREVREACALLQAAVELIAEQANHTTVRRPIRRSVKRLTARGSEHIARALDELRTAPSLRPVPAQGNTGQLELNDHVESPAVG